MAKKTKKYATSGNPKKGSIRKTVYLELALIERWRQAALERGESMTSILNKALSSWLILKMEVGLSRPPRVGVDWNPFVSIIYNR